MVVCFIARGLMVKWSINGEREKGWTLTAGALVRFVGTVGDAVAVAALLDADIRTRLAGESADGAMNFARIWLKAPARVCGLICGLAAADCRLISQRA